MAKSKITKDSVIGMADEAPIDADTPYVDNKEDGKPESAKESEPQQELNPGSGGNYRYEDGKFIKV